MEVNPFRILFSDIDGTCVHYDVSGLSWAAAPDADGLWSVTASSDGATTSLLKMPPSLSSGAQGVISAESLRQYSAIRALGVKVVLISGARMSTILQRLPYLPAADAIVCESGGRIFYPSNTLPTFVGLREDQEWRESLSQAAGPAAQEGVPPMERTGLLWEQYRKMKTGGFILDATSYTTAFRVKSCPSAVYPSVKQSLPPGLAASTNLGAMDIYPAASGKLNAARYLMRRFGADTNGHQCAFMCDDDNDLELAFCCRKAYLPSITAESVRQAVRESPGKFYVVRRQGVWGTEEVLQHLIERAAAQ